jgi:mannose-6-phosphate isomerase-like protein (cupin superfamily)
MFKNLKNSEFMNPEKVNIAEKLSLFNDHWNPRIVGELNGQHVKLVKLLGEFVWHKHDIEDEMFLVISGTLRMEFRDKTVEVYPNEFIIVPRGVEHRPVAEKEVEIMLFEPASTLNTGDTKGELTREVLEKI